MLFRNGQINRQANGCQNITVLKLWWRNKKKDYACNLHRWDCFINFGLTETRSNTDYITHLFHHHLHFNVHFPGKPGFASSHSVLFLNPFWKKPHRFLCRPDTHCRKLLYHSLWFDNFAGIFQLQAQFQLPDFSRYVYENRIKSKPKVYNNNSVLQAGYASRHPTNSI